MHDCFKWQSPDGDIIDCINIYHQPAFDHPLLKNHTILVRLSIPPKSKKREKSLQVHVYIQICTHNCVSN